MSETVNILTVRTRFHQISVFTLNIVRARFVLSYVVIVANVVVATSVVVTFVGNDYMIFPGDVIYDKYVQRLPRNKH